MAFPRLLKNKPVDNHASFSIRLQGQIYTIAIWSKNQNFPSEEMTSGTAVVIVYLEFIQCLINSTWQINSN
jgi:hypothetical protein